MKLPSIIRVPKHQRFNYEPRHFDPIKEEMKEREERIRATMQGSNPQKINIQFRENLRRHQKEDMRSNSIVLVLIAVFLILFVLYLLV